MKLSENFTLDEFTKTGTGLPNNPGFSEKHKLQLLAIYILQPTRDHVGPIAINSGYRSFQVNTEIDGSKTSQHMFGEAADIRPLESDISEVFAWMKDNLKYGQLILEARGTSKWIHVSLPRMDKENQMAMLAQWNELTMQYEYTRVH